MAFWEKPAVTWIRKLILHTFLNTMWKHLRYELYPMVETSKDKRSKKILCYLTPSGPWTHKHENRFLSLVIKSADFCRFVYSFKQSTNAKDTSSNFPQAPTIGWFSPQFYTIYSNFSPPAKYSLDNLFVVLSQYLKLTFNSIFSEYVFHLFCIKHRTQLWTEKPFSKNCSQHALFIIKS